MMDVYFDSYGNVLEKSEGSALGSMRRRWELDIETPKDRYVLVRKEHELRFNPEGEVIAILRAGKWSGRGGGEHQGP